jgi:hypothetical protein
MEGAFFGSIIFEFIGAFAKWVFYAFRNKLQGQKITSFMRIWMGRKGARGEELILQGFSNIGLGMLLSVIILSILVWLGV